MAVDSVITIDSHPIKVTDDDIYDILVTAFHGSDYWIMSVTMQGESRGKDTAEHVARGGEAKIVFLEADDGGNMDTTLTKDSILHALEKWYIEGYDCYYAISPAGIDSASIDAAGADALLQLALFTEVLYS